jgi:hypothetical protein
MPYPTELTKDCLGIVHAGSGLVTGEDLMVACEGVTQLVQNTANFQYEFSDFTDVTELRLKPGDLEKIVELDQIAAKYRPRAIVVIVAPQEFSYELACTWSERVKDIGWTIHISRDRSEAVRWLTQHIKTERPELLAERNENAA